MVESKDGESRDTRRRGAGHLVQVLGDDADGLAAGGGGQGVVRLRLEAAGGWDGGGGGVDEGDPHHKHDVGVPLPRAGER
jgi:hypothetical protein